VTVAWRKLHKGELHDLYSSLRIIRIIKSRRMRCSGHVVPVGEKRNLDRLLVGKPERKRPLRRPSHRWVDNIKVDLVQIGLGELDWFVWLRIGTGGEPHCQQVCHGGMHGLCCNLVVILFMVAHNTCSHTEIGNQIQFCRNYRET
jgi:hypothetical protein